MTQDCMFCETIEWCLCYQLIALSILTQPGHSTINCSCVWIVCINCNFSYSVHGVLKTWTAQDASVPDNHFGDETSLWATVYRVPTYSTQIVLPSTVQYMSFHMCRYMLWWPSPACVCKITYILLLHIIGSLLCSVKPSTMISGFNQATRCPGQHFIEAMRFCVYRLVWLMTK